MTDQVHISRLIYPPYAVEMVEKVHPLWFSDGNQAEGEEQRNNRGSICPSQQAQDFIGLFTTVGKSQAHR